MKPILHAPAPSIKTFVREIWEMDGSARDESSHSFAFFADGHPGLFFQFSPSGMFLNQGNKKLAPLFLHGQTVKPIDISVKGPFNAIVFQLYPHAIKALYGMNARELTDTCLDVSLLDKNFNLGLTDLLLNTKTVNDRIDILTAYLFRIVQRGRGDLHDMIRYSVNQIVQSKGRAQLQDIHQRLKISERTFERRFEQYVGISPRLFSRICNFKEAYSQLKRNGYDRLSDVAFDNGYADQSHFIRTFREFTGYSPLQFQKTAKHVISNPVSEATLALDA